MLRDSQWRHTVFSIIKDLYGFKTARSTIPAAHCGIIWTRDYNSAVWLVELHTVYFLKVDKYWLTVIWERWFLQNMSIYMYNKQSKKGHCFMVKQVWHIKYKLAILLFYIHICSFFSVDHWTFVFTCLLEIIVILALGTGTRQCAVPENIHTPSTEGIGASWG